jgi:hypothetical protein
VKMAERSFEEAIECALLENGPDACPGDAVAFRETPAPYAGRAVPGGCLTRRPADYDRRLCLLPRDVLAFLLATQPREWEKLRQHYGGDVKERFLGRLSREIGRRGALDVLRNGVKDSGCAFRLAYFRPASGLNEGLQRLHAANLFALRGPGVAGSPIATPTPAACSAGTSFSHQGAAASDRRRPAGSAVRRPPRPAREPG